jgi:iron complex outermembrane receptor protein
MIHGPFRAPGAAGFVNEDKVFQVNMKLLLAGVAVGAIHAPLLAQDAAPPAPQAAQAPPVAEVPPAADANADADADADADTQLDEDEGQEIVVTGSKPRGSVIGDIPPDIQLNRRDIRAYGASSMAELLDALAPQTRSGRGRGGEQPVTLLNGRRISGFSEIRDIPPEAIERVDILPEEVALKYGYRADQRVVNIVLRRRFRASTAEGRAVLATAGGRASYTAEASTIRINQDQRANIAARFTHADA